MTHPPSPQASPLADAITRALHDDDPAALDRLHLPEPADQRDRFLTLLCIYGLHTAPLDQVGGAARHQHHPVIATAKSRCESDWLAELGELTVPPAEVADTMRALAARERLPAVYRWLAREATWPQVVQFLALEGGPDAGFDDLVAACQVGLVGSAKLELATNYWDEMGNGNPAAVHTTLHDDLVRAIDMPVIAPKNLPVSALARNALGGLLATNRWLQPEMLGALGLIELQAGPRCRLVVQALQRCGAPAAALPFYAVHADVDPHHGKDWLDKAIEPQAVAHPDWGPRIIRGALWRSAIDAAFVEEVTALLGQTGPDERAADAA